MIRIGVAAVFAIAGLRLAAVEGQSGIDKLVGQPVDIAPWAYQWRSDVAVQQKPEAYFSVASARVRDGDSAGAVVLAPDYGSKDED